MKISKEMVWKIICSQMEKKNPSLAAILAKCSLLGIKDGAVTIRVPAGDFTYRMIKRDKNWFVLKRALEGAFEGPVKIFLAHVEEIGNLANDDSLF